MVFQPQADDPHSFGLMFHANFDHPLLRGTVPSGRIFWGWLRGPRISEHEAEHHQKDTPRTNQPSNEVEQISVLKTSGACLLILTYSDVLRRESSLSTRFARLEAEVRAGKVANLSATWRIQTQFPANPLNQTSLLLVNQFRVFQCAQRSFMVRF